MMTDIMVVKMTTVEAAVHLIMVVKIMGGEVEVDTMKGRGVIMETMGNRDIRGIMDIMGIKVDMKIGEAETAIEMTEGITEEEEEEEEEDITIVLVAGMTEVDVVDGVVVEEVDVVEAGEVEEVEEAEV